MKINIPNNQESKHIDGPWYAVEYAGHFNLQIGPYYGEQDVLDAESYGYESAQASAFIASAAPEAVEFIINLLTELAYNNSIDYKQMEANAEKILNKAYNL